MRTRSVRSLLLTLLVLAVAAPTWAASVEEEVSLGKQVMAQVRQFGLTDDPSLNKIGERLAEVVKREDLPWRFWVIEDLHIYNAFAARGGFVFITRTYYEKLNDDEAAFVLGHEMAHVDLGHHGRQAKRSRNANLGNLLLKVLIEGRGSWGTAIDVGSTAYVTRYSRVLEREADLAGYQYANAAGYDARAAVTALSKLGEQPAVHPWIVNIYSTHPLLSSREDRLAALGGEEPEEIPAPEPSPSHARNLTQGLDPFDPPRPIAVRILAPDGKQEENQRENRWENRWESRWRKDFTKHLHRRLVPLGFEIAGDDLMYTPNIGDPVEAARSREARYLLLATVHRMESEETGPAELSGTPVRATVEVAACLIAVEDGSEIWAGRFAEEKDGRDVLPTDPETLYTDTCVGALAEAAAGEIAAACAKAIGAEPAEDPDEGGQATGAAARAAVEAADREKAIPPRS